MSALLILENPALSVEPGGEAVCSCRVRNTSAVVDQVSLRVLGPAAAWTVADPPVVSLFPNEEGTVALRMRPTAGVPAGSVHFGVMLVSATDPGATVVEEGTVQVGAFVAVTARLVPRVAKARASGKHRLIVHNTGNAPALVRVSASDPDDVIRFKGLTATPTTVLPGAKQPVRIRYRSVASHMTGPAEPHEFSVSVVPEGGAPVTVQGTFSQRAAIAGWIPKAAVAVIAVLALVLILHSLSSSGQPGSQALRAAGTGATTSSSDTGSGSGSGSGTSTGSGSATTGGGGSGSGSSSSGAGSSTGSGGGGGATAKPIGGGGTGATAKPTSGGNKTTPTAAAAPTPTPAPVIDLPAIFTKSTSEIDTLVGGSPHTLTTAGIGGTWSPDGKSLAFYHSGTGNLAVGTYDGNVVSGIHDLVTTQCNCSYATWSPDGAYIAFYDKNGNLDVVAPSTGVVQTWLPSAAAVSGWPGWTANSAYVVFPRSDGLYAVPRGGGAARVIVTTNATSSEGVTFSSDGVLMGWSSGGSTYVAHVDAALNLTNPHQVGSGKEPSFERTKETFYVIYSSDLWQVDANGAMYNGSNLTNSGNCDYSRS